MSTSYKRKMKNSGTLLTLAALFSLPSLNPWFIQKSWASGEIKFMKTSRAQAIEIANREAERLGYKTTTMNLELDEHNTFWNKYISSGPSFWPNNPWYKEKLKNKEYWAVYYAPKIPQKGGDLWCFIDRTTGEVITHLKGK